MKKFIKNIFIFCVLSSCICILLILTALFFCRYTFDFGIPKDKNVLIVGNSHPQCAINDDIVPNTINISQGGASYFYSYLKIKSITDYNSHIDTVVLGYSYNDLSIGKDLWFSGDEKIKFFMRNHFFLFTMEDYFSLLEANPISTLIYTPQTILYNLGISFCGISCLGGYKYLKRYKLMESKRRLEEKKKSKPQNESILEYSKYQKKYLIKIYDFCQKNNLSLILLNTPIHPYLEKNSSELVQKYYDFPQIYIPKAKIINHSNFEMEEEGFGDISHLNYKGAKIYSEFLKKTRFKY